MSAVPAVDAHSAAAQLETDQAKQTQGFKHSPLPDALEYIRLLSVKPERHIFGTDATYSLSTWHFDEVPEYHAISYTWGPADGAEVIELEGKPKSVRKNSADVLRQLCHFRTAEYYWIDTLCIDQDNLEENSCQVAVTGYIYEEAEHVLVCIGSIEGERHSSLDLLCEYGKYRRSSDDSRRRFQHRPINGDSSRYLDNLWELRRQQCQHSVDWTRHCRAVDVLDLWILCTRLSTRDYFARVWTTPEFLLARSARFYVGDYCVLWEALYELMGMIEIQSCANGFRLYVTIPGKHEISILQSAHLADADLQRATANMSDLSDMQKAETLFREKQNLSEYKSWTHRKDSLDITGVIRLTENKACCDPRDTIFAMLPF